MREAKNIEGMERDHAALVRLGCFEQREFQLISRLLTEKNRKAFSKMLSKASLINDYPAIMMTATNLSSISITAHLADMPAWQELIEQFDAEKPK